jgi:hypothetical protein
VLLNHPFKMVSARIDIRHTLRDKLAFGNHIFVTVARKSNLAWVSEEQAEVTT